MSGACISFLVHDTNKFQSKKVTLATTVKIPLKRQETNLKIFLISDGNEVSSLMSEALLSFQVLKTAKIVTEKCLPYFLAILSKNVSGKIFQCDTHLAKIH